MAEDLNLVAPGAEQRPSSPGDVPEQVRRRYLTEHRGGPGLGFYADVRAEVAAFRDQGRRLTTSRNDPQVVRDLVAIAEHRGWSTLNVRGHTEFRREVWLLATAAGLEVRGYRPTERDREHVRRRTERPSEPDAIRSGGPARLRIVESVVQARVAERADQERIVRAARSRIAHWLEQGATFTPSPRRERTRG